MLAEDPLKIAVIAPVWLPAPPSGYGGTEQIASVLTEQLVELGHDVTLFAPGDSTTGAKLVSYYDEAPGVSKFYENRLFELWHVLTAYTSIEQFDVVHDHTYPIGPSLGAFAGATRPVVHTVHNSPAAGRGREYYGMIDDRSHLVAISEAQRRATPEIRYRAVVHNGLVIDGFPFSAEKQDFGLYVGRLWEDKGADQAIIAARAAGIGLKLAVKEPEFDFEHEYFRTRVEPLLGPGIEFLGEIGFDEKVELYRTARCTIVPTMWEEPFGLTTLESLACGTPVVGIDRGGTGEIVEHGVTGWLADDPSGLPGLVARSGEIDPAACRRAAEERFQARTMAENYVRVYRDAIAER
jgi:glycosyltransferase involved in cell wall biosynthesis